MMTAYAQDQYRDADPDRVVIAQAEGIVSARHHLGIAGATAWLRDEAHALGVPLGWLAEDVVNSADAPDRVAAPRPRPVGRPGWACLDLDEELALHEEMWRRRPEPLRLDETTEVALRRLLG